MDNCFWWDTGNDRGFVNSILKFSVEARKWYLKTDVKVRLKRFITRNTDFDENVQLWKRLQIVKNDFGEEIGGQIVQQAVKETQEEFNDPKWGKAVLTKIKLARKGLNDNTVKML